MFTYSYIHIHIPSQLSIHVISKVSNDNYTISTIIPYVATQFFTHLLDKIFEKSKIAKNNENPNKYVFLNIFASFLAFSTSSQKNLNFQRYFERI